MLILGKKLEEIAQTSKMTSKIDLCCDQKHGPNRQTSKKTKSLQLTTFVHNAYLCMETLCQFKVDSFKKTFKLVNDNNCQQILTKRGTYEIYNK